ncbi:MAG TPA: ATP-dependent DNA helicase RecG [Mariprofundaceae bacterium]|nr:ATP-dependent DNA helicase RecG [Mariprofundaceae bacterium]
MNASLYGMLLEPLGQIAGVGPALEKRLAGRGIQNLGDLLLHFPKDYEDDREVVPIALLGEGIPARIVGHIVRKTARGFGRNRQVNIVLADETGQISLHFFHSGYMMSDARLSEGRQISVRGVPEIWKGHLQMSHPEWQVTEQYQPGFRPVYPTLAGLTSRRLSDLIGKALGMLPQGAASPLDSKFTDLPVLARSLSMLHQPDGLDGLAAARQRCQLEELTVYLQLMREKKRQAEIAAPSIRAGTKVQQLLASLPFPLTKAQSEVWQEIADDLASGKRMHRLVQGDVGAGKTWVAALALAACADAGLQAAIMAPTEVLAGQHAATLAELLEPAGIEVELLTGSTPAAAKRKIRQGLADGSTSCVIGTHALIADTVGYHRLGLAIVDEQHRFGVKQRWALAERGQAVHLLGMTATPIPRSLALALYGDLDLSVMHGMPPGRKPVDTRVLTRRGQLAEGLDRIMDEGGQVYWIVPRIDEEEDGVSVEQRAVALRERFPEANVLPLHGRMKSADKSAALEAFSAGRSRMLVSTTVIEVGVNVPAARVIVIEHADRYGLAQLHQLRGRVGRSEAQGYCILIPGKEASESAIARLQRMVATHDGLELAEADLGLRGSGDAIGTRQSGEAGFRLIDPACDASLIRRYAELLPEAMLPEEAVRFWRPAAEAVD